MSELVRARLILITFAGSHEAGASGGRQCLNLCVPPHKGKRNSGKVFQEFGESFVRILEQFGKEF